MSEPNDFLGETLPLYQEAEIALHNGDADPRFSTWSHRDPVTLFGAAFTVSGWSEIGPVFERLAASFSGCVSYRNEILASGESGDLAYMVAHEHTTAAIHGGPPRPYVLRVTTIFRREDGLWRVVHRHADPASDTALELVEHLSSAET